MSADPSRPAPVLKDHPLVLPLHPREPVESMLKRLRRAAAPLLAEVRTRRREPTKSARRRGKARRAATRRRKAAERRARAGIEEL